MRVSAITINSATAILSFASTALCAVKGNLTKPLTSRQILPSNFKPAQNFQNVNLVHLINLEKAYPRETINVVIENIARTAQDEYYLPFTSEQMAIIGGLEVKDKKDLESGLFDVAAVEFDTERYEDISISDYPSNYPPVIPNSIAYDYLSHWLPKPSRRSALHTPTCPLWSLYQNKWVNKRTNIWFIPFLHTAPRHMLH
jgi:oligosaccharyltransferase complex subunit alpha (ribophorin I)